MEKKMGDRVSIQFSHKGMEWGDKSVVLFHHWGGEKFADFAKGWAIDFKMKVLKLHYLKQQKHHYQKNVLNHRLHYYHQLVKENY